jgi:crotonobetainyl-CoA:carnitine CoA-transferase CaiB-like acyl-CoA transferase
VVLDTTAGDGRSALLALLEDADVFVTNVRPASLARARLDYDALKDAFPALIYASVSGYGLEGPEADIPAFDLTGFWTRTGVAASTIPPDQEPFPCRPGFGDHVTALATLSGVLAAVYERGRTGRGRLVEASLMRAGVYALGWDASLHLRYGQTPTAQPRAERPSAMSGFFRTADDRWFCLVPRGPRCFAALLTAIGRPDILADPRFTPPIADIDDVRQLRAIFDAAFAGVTLDAVAAMLNAADLIWAPMASLAEVAADPQAQAAGCFVSTPDRFGGAFTAPAAPVRFPGLPTEPRAPAPALGEHTREALLEAGWAEAAVDALLRAGAAFQSPPGAREA